MDFFKSPIGFFMQNKTFLKRISRKVCMQRYNGVIEGEHAKKWFLEIGDKWIFSTHGQKFRGGIQLHVFISLLIEAR